VHVSQRNRFTPPTSSSAGPRTDAGAVRYILAVLVGVAFGLIFYPSPWGILVAALVSAALSRLFTLLEKVKEGARLRTAQGRPPRKQGEWRGRAS
jgi:hypothetical protein